MKEEEFNLSDKEKVIGEYFGCQSGNTNVYDPEDVKEFIKRLKEETFNHKMVSTSDKQKILMLIDKLAGEKLI